MSPAISQADGAVRARGPTPASDTPARSAATTADAHDELPPLGSRLWLYTNFNCNLACDYCCSESSPHAVARRISSATAARAIEEFAGLGGRELLLTGGEPFLHPELDELIRLATRFPLRVTVLTNAMVFQSGSRRRMLERIDPSRVAMQVSLDSATPGLHDAHRGRGSFQRAWSGIQLLRELGFRVRVAATIDARDAEEAQRLHTFLDGEGFAPEDRLIRPVAQTGFADRGVAIAIDRLWPEPTLTAEGAWWHPVAVADSSMQVSSTPLPVVTALAVIRATLNDSSRDRTAALEAFRCT